MMNRDLWLLHGAAAFLAGQQGHEARAILGALLQVIIWYPKSYISILPKVANRE